MCLHGVSCPFPASSEYNKKVLIIIKHLPPVLKLSTLSHHKESGCAYREEGVYGRIKTRLSGIYEDRNRASRCYKCLGSSLLLTAVLGVRLHCCQPHLLQLQSYVHHGLFSTTMGTFDVFKMGYSVNSHMFVAYMTGTAGS